MPRQGLNYYALLIGLLLATNILRQRPIDSLIKLRGTAEVIAKLGGK